MLELLARRRDVRVPDLRLTTACELHVALAEGRLELQQQQRLLDVENAWHEALEGSAGERPECCPQATTGA